MGHPRALLAKMAVFLGHNIGSKTPCSGVQGQPMAVDSLLVQAWGAQDHPHPQPAELNPVLLILGLPLVCAPCLARGPGQATSQSGPGARSSVYGLEMKPFPF